MNVQRLKIALEAVRCGSLTKAAEELGYTQSGLTYALNSLENELGLTIAVRDAFGIRLSRDGEELLPYIEEMIACEERLLTKAKQIRRMRGSVLNVAAYPSMAAIVLPAILADFNRACPNVMVNIEVVSREDMINSLREKRCDFGFGGKLWLPECEWMPLIRDVELAILPQDFPDEGMHSFPIAEFKKHPFAHPVYWAEEHDISKQLEENGVEAQFVINSYDNAPIIAMVEQGIALSAIPKMTIAGSARVKTLPVDPPCYRLLGVNYRQDCTEADAAKHFLRCLARRIYVEDGA